jgi:ubiquinone/menaquinone biosynthesis C-methylase UbiE
MPHLFDPARRKRLTSAERRKRLPPEKILAEIGLKPGDVFVDIGCGPGFFTLPAARRVGPRGKAVGLDIAPEMISDLILAARRDQLANVKAVLAPPGKPRLPRGAAYYFLANVFHEVDDKPALLRTVKRRSGRTSRLVIIDYYKKKTKHGPPIRDRVSPARLAVLLKRAGFAVERVWPVNDEEYGLIAKPV